MMGGERFPHVTSDYLCASYAAGSTLAALAKETGMGPESVRVRIHRAGHSTRPRSGTKPRGALDDVFVQSFERRGPNECWPWKGCLGRGGYGRISVGSFRTTAHRYAVMREGVEIPEGYEVDHLCFNPPCVNPAHLEPVTPAENRRRRRFALKTHCRRGHPLTSENTIVEGGGRVRRCRVCRTSQRQRERANQEA